MDIELGWVRPDAVARARELVSRDKWFRAEEVADALLAETATTVAAIRLSLR